MNEINMIIFLVKTEDLQEFRYEVIEDHEKTKRLFLV